MVLLKNDLKTFDCQSMIPLFVRDKENDCVLYSKDGGKFNVCKEVLYQTKFLRNILVSANNICCKDIEIFCPCPDNELESMVNFLYSGSISYDTKVFKYTRFVFIHSLYLNNYFNFHVCLYIRLFHVYQN